MESTLLSELKVCFLTKTGDNIFAGSLIPNVTDTHNIGSPTRRIDSLYVRNLVAETVTSEGGGGGNADTLDGFHASSAPTANTILPLDTNAVFPQDVYPRALLLDGSRTLTGNLEVAPYIRIDGVDISELSDLFTTHDSETAIEAHVSLGTYVRAGAGLENVLITGELDPDVGLQNKQEIFLALATPGTLSISSRNSKSGSHTHAVVASSDPGMATALLKTADDGSLILGSGLLQVQTATGRVGVGTLTPGYKLQVEGDGYFSDDLIIRGDLVDARLAEGWFEHLTIDSTDLTTNLNADLLDGRHGWQYRQSDTYLAGVRGWRLFDNGDAEFNNILARGRLDAVVYTERQVSAVSGQMLLSIGAKVASDVDPVDSVIVVDAPVFSTDDIIQMSEGTAHEWLRISGTFTLVADGFQYPVARNINEDPIGAKSFTPGAVCVRRGAASYFREARPLAAGVKEGAFGQYQPGGSGSSTGGGWIILDGAHPFIAVEARKGPVWDQFDRVVHIGNLQGSQLEGRYEEETYGVVFGDANNYFAYDQQNGLEIHTLGATTAESMINQDGMITESLGVMRVLTAPARVTDRARVYFWKNAELKPELRVRMDTDGIGYYDVPLALTPDTDFTARDAALRNASTSENMTVGADLGVSGDANVGGAVNAAEAYFSALTGTPPFGVASTTRVSNLNADMVDSMHASSVSGGNRVVATDSSGHINTVDLKASGHVFTNGETQMNPVWRMYAYSAVQTPTEQFEGTAIPAGSSWAGSPFITPPNLYFGNSTIEANSGATVGARSFLVFPSTKSLLKFYEAWCVPGHLAHGTSVGIRLDDGTDNNYEELVCVTSADANKLISTEVIWRERIGGGTATATSLMIANAPLSAFISMQIQGTTQWSNWYVAMRPRFPLSKVYASQSSNVLTWTPSRVGIVWQTRVSTTARSSVDWFNY